MVDNKTIIKIKEDPIVIRMTSKGIPGRTGPAGAKGDDGISWELSLIMEDSPDGRCTMRLYKDGMLCTQETHYAYVQILKHNEANFAPVPALHRNFTGTYSFNYTNARSIFVAVYEDSFMEKVICSNSVNYGRSATIDIGTVKSGAQAKVTNSGTPLDAVFNFILPKGDQGEVAVAADQTETLPAGADAYVEDLLPNDPNRALLKFGIPNGAGPGARVEGRRLILDAGAIFTPAVSTEGIISWTNNASLDNPPSVDIRGPKGDKGDKGDKGESEHLGSLALLDKLDYNSDILVNKPDIAAMLSRLQKFFPGIPYEIMLATWLVEEVLFMQDPFAEYINTEEEPELIVLHNGTVVMFLYEPESEALIIKLYSRGYLEDAPHDDNYYIRRNGNWELFELKNN